MGETASTPEAMTVPEGAVIVVPATEAPSAEATAEAAVRIAEIDAEVRTAEIESRETLALAEMEREENTPGELSWQDDRDILQAQLDALRQELSELQASQLLASEAAVLATQSIPPSPSEPASEPMTETKEEAVPMEPRALAEAPADPPDRARKRLRRL